MVSRLNVLKGDKDYGACGLAAIINENGEPFSGRMIADAMSIMDERTNGLGGGFGVYGVFPELKDYYALHLFFDDDTCRREAMQLFEGLFEIEHTEPVPIKPNRLKQTAPVVWRYFVKPNLKEINERSISEDNYIVSTVMKINSDVAGAYVVSSGKNLAVFKGNGYPSEVAEYFRIDEYRGYSWLGHGRFPTNTPGWWGGAHPFALLNWSVIHNGEISSYGINKRYLEMFGYKCTLQTDTEVMTYLFDLLIRRHGLSLEDACLAIAPPFWSDIDRMGEEESEFHRSIRIVYASALANGPFAIVLGGEGFIMGLSDRIKLRPLVAARKGDFFYLASEESAVRYISPYLDEVWMPDAGQPVFGRLRTKVGI
jgi:glutamate synthase domain-containing protein 1